jgi:excinuclease ABC subunit B
LRDEIKRLQEVELAISGDPMAREVEQESPDSGRRKGQHNKGKARHRTVDEGGLFRKPELDEMGTSGDHARPAGKSLFRKNDLDEMTVGRTEKPVTGSIPAKPDNDAKAVKRYKAGAGSYEDPADQRKETRRSRKTGRPGR